MHPVLVNDRVRLTHDVPHLSLHRGDTGIVQSVWFATSPIAAYEVEFPGAGSNPCRALLCADDVEPGDSEAHRPGDNTLH